METEQFRFNPSCSTVDNPDSQELNTGTLLPIGDVDSILETIGSPLQDLLYRYMECDAPYFNIDSKAAEALYRLPGYDVFFTTYFDELPEVAIYEGVEPFQLPVTTIIAFRRAANGKTYDDDGRPIHPAFFAPFRGQL